MEPIEDSDMKKIAVIQGTSDLHPASDAHTFTQELFKIYKEENGEIQILQIVRYLITSLNKLPLLSFISKVNESWDKRNIKQLSKHDIVESGNNWKYYMWPASICFIPKQDNATG